MGHLTEFTGKVPWTGDSACLCGYKRGKAAICSLLPHTPQQEGAIGTLYPATLPVSDWSARANKTLEQHESPTAAGRGTWAPVLPGAFWHIFDGRMDVTWAVRLFSVRGRREGG